MAKRSKTEQRKIRREMEGKARKAFRAYTGKARASKYADKKVARRTSL